MSWLDTLSEIRQRDWTEADAETRGATASEVVVMSSYAGAATSVVPLPLLDLALLIPVHSAMVMTVGHVYGRPMTKTEATRVVLELGAIAGVTFAGRAAISAIKKVLLPGLGGLLAAPATFALTWALGRVAIAYFETPGLSQDELRKVFKDAVKESKSVFSKERLASFGRQATEATDDAPRGEPEDSDAPPPPAADPQLRSKKRSL